MLTKLEARRSKLWDALVSREKAAISGQSWTKRFEHEPDSLVDGMHVTTLDCCSPKGSFDNDVKQGFRHIQVYCNFYTLFLICVVDHRLPFGYQLISTFKNMVEKILHSAECTHKTSKHVH